jgi:CHRD domain
MKRILVCLLLAAALAAPPLALASGGATASLRTTMTGRKAVPRGAKRGRTTVTVRISGRRVCWTFGRMRGIDKPRAAFIKKGIPGEFGPVIVQLGRRFRVSGCATTTTGNAQQMVLSPHGYYVTVNTRRFPLGAVRGQLHKA